MGLRAKARRILAAIRAWLRRAGTPRRLTDSDTPVAIWWARWGRDMTTFAAVALAAWAVLNTVHERASRTDQTCTVFEQQHKDDVDQLIATYRYLASLSGEELAQPLNRFVLGSLPGVIREAQTDDAPPYCDEPGVGLPEPDPVVPERPRALPPP